jgi:hypothetical protein
MLDESLSNSDKIEELEDAMTVSLIPYCCSFLIVCPSRNGNRIVSVLISYFKALRICQNS